MLQTTHQPTIKPEKLVSIVTSLHNSKPKSAVKEGEGSSKAKDMTPLSQTEGLPLNNRVIESNTITVTSEEFLETKMLTTASISDFLTLELTQQVSKFITHIKFSSPYFTYSDIQSYQEDLETFLILLRLHRKSFPELKEVTFGTPPQPDIYVKEYQKPIDIPFHGVLFNAPRGPTSAPMSANFNALLSYGVKTLMTRPIRDFLNDPYIFNDLPRVTKIEISPIKFSNNDIQSYKEDMEIFISELHRLKILLPNLKTVYFQASPQPWIQITESTKPENISFCGIYFSDESFRESF